MIKKILLGISIISIFILTFFVITSNSTKQPMYTDISLQDYKTKIENEETLYVYLYQTTCAVCQQTKPILNETIQEMDVTVFSLDADKDENQDISFFEQQKLEKTPTIIKYVQGKEVDRIVGSYSKDRLVELMSN